MLKSMLNTLTLVLALSFSFSTHAWDEDTETKFQAQALMNVFLMQAETSTLLKDMGDMTNTVGISKEDSRGILKALGVNETAAARAMKNINALVEAMKQSKNPDEIFSGNAQVDTLRNEIRDLHQDSKALLEKSLRTDSL